MSSVTPPRGRLPRRVYWVRRLVLLGIVLLLVVGVSRLVGGSGSSGDPQARAVGATASAGPSSLPAPQATPSADAVASAPARPSASGAASGAATSKTPLAVPTGPCRDSDVQIAPSVDRPAYAGHDIVFTLNLSTRESPACTWVLSTGTAMLKVSSGQDRVWSTQDCRRALPRQTVVVRKDVVTKVHVVWTGQESSHGSCSRTTPWAMPGSYHATAAVFGFEPVETEFVLELAPRRRITKSPSPSAGASESSSSSPTGH